MQMFNNRGELVGEINDSITQNGERIITNTTYYRGRPVAQYISVRQGDGTIRTTNVLNGKILP